MCRAATQVSGPPAKKAVTLFSLKTNVFCGYSLVSGLFDCNSECLMSARGLVAE